MSEFDCENLTRQSEKSEISENTDQKTKCISYIHIFKHCYKCPYKQSNGVMSAIYCAHFNPPRQILDINGHDCEIKDGESFPSWCPV